MMTELPKNYDPSEAEERLYQGWVDAGYFKPSEDPEKPPCTMVIPLLIWDTLCGESLGYVLVT